MDKQKDRNEKPVNDNEVIDLNDRGEWLNEDTLTKDRLLELFSSDMFHSKFLDDGIQIIDGLPYPISVCVDNERAVMEFKARHQLKDSFIEFDLINFVSQMNSTTNPCTVYVQLAEEGPDYLVGKSYLTLLHGVDVLQIHSHCFVFAYAFQAICSADDDREFLRDGEIMDLSVK